jgi:hypothetical protein
MTTNLGLPALVLSALLVTGCGAAAQTAGMDEAIGASGQVVPTPTLTLAQRAAIYTAVMQQRIRSSEQGIAPVIGAQVPASARLHDLPGEVALAGDEQDDLKYAMVADDVVVVDPIRMRVIDVIHAGTRP